MGSPEPASAGVVAVDVGDEVGGGAGVDADVAAGAEFGDDGVGDGSAWCGVEVGHGWWCGAAGVDGDVAVVGGLGGGDVQGDGGGGIGDAGASGDVELGD